MNERTASKRLEEESQTRAGSCQRVSSLLTFSIPRLSLSITYSRCTTYELLLRSRRAQKDRFIGWEREEEEEEEGWLGLALWLLSIPPFLATYSAQIFRAFHLLLPPPLSRLKCRKKKMKWHQSISYDTIEISTFHLWFRALLFEYSAFRNSCRCSGKPMPLETE